LDSRQQWPNSVRGDGRSNPTAKSKYDLVVIGGGTAGLVAAAGAAQLGAQVALIEQHSLGGDCLNFGCVPSKALLHQASDIFHRTAPLADAEARYAIGAERFPDVIRALDKARDTLSHHDSVERFTKLGVDLFFGRASFASHSSISVDGTALHFRKAIVAIGTKPSIPHIPGLAESGYLTNETLFSLKRLPKRLLVIGGGPIGCEMAQAFNRLGSQVFLVEVGPNLLPKDEQAAGELVKMRLTAEGVKVHLLSEVTEVTKQDNAYRANIKNNQSSQSIVFDEVLVAAGRKSDWKSLQPQLASIELTDNSEPILSDFLQTTNRHVFSAGDCTSFVRFTHAADAQSRIALRNALFLGRSRVSRLIVPHCTFTQPEIAQVGQNAEELVRRQIPFSTYEVHYRDIDRAVMDQLEDGWIRIYCQDGTDRILGASIAGKNAGELIGFVTFAMTRKIGLKRFSESLQPYPTLTDGLRKLGDQYQRTRLTPWVRTVLKWLARRT
jgi:pyruvate/2-oxoglutarate dehydrogenase complex dihydrolipoamide dehydrogenase (E3) component